MYLKEGKIQPLKRPLGLLVDCRDLFCLYFGVTQRTSISTA